MDGHRHSVTSADGTEIGLLTAGDGPPLLLVHGGMGRIEGWQPLWKPLASRWRVTAMDRRGRGTSGDTPPYDLSREFEDVAAVATSLAGGIGIDVFAHSFGAVCALGAAASGAPIARLALYEPPGPQTVPAQWRDRVLSMIAAGQPGRAMLSFLTEIIGLTQAQVSELRDAPRGYDVLPIVSATMPRESQALAGVDLTELAYKVSPAYIPVLLVVGASSPAWALDISRQLDSLLGQSTLALLNGQGHDAIDAAPAQLLNLVEAFLVQPGG